MDVPQRDHDVTVSLCALELVMAGQVDHHAVMHLPPGYEMDVERVLRACAKYDVVVEINAHPWRLDLDWRWHQAALAFGCMIASIRTRTRFPSSTTCTGAS